MIVALLTYLTCCAKEGIQVNFVDSDYADFDITYVRKEKKSYWHRTYYEDVTYSTTYHNRGWFVVFREYINRKPRSLHFVKGSNNGVADYDDIHFETITSVDPVTGYLSLCFNITNNGDEPKRIDVGVFADIQVAGNDYATVIPLENRRGFTMTDPDTGITFTLLVKDASGTTNVDAFYYGKFNRRWAEIYDDYYNNQVVNYYPKRFPYFKNITTTPTNLENEDSVFAFSWQKRDIYPGKTLSYGTTAGTGSNLKSPPFAKWTCDFKDNYDPYEKVT
ncbi:dextransucrase protein, partial [Trichomonas vaginalis G3]